jgi:hypothetical protein
MKVIDLLLAQDELHLDFNGAHIIDEHLVKCAAFRVVETLVRRASEERRKLIQSPTPSGHGRAAKMTRPTGGKAHHVEVHEGGSIGPGCGFRQERKADCATALEPR